MSKSSHPIGKAAEALASIGHPDASPMPMLDVQRKLNYLGFGPLPETGTKDAATTKAIKDFQSKVNLTIDGIVGPKTSAAIRTAIDEKNRSELGKTQDIALLAPPDTATAPSDPFLPSDLSSAIAATEGATGVSGWWR